MHFQCLCMYVCNNTNFQNDVQKQFKYQYLSLKSVGNKIMKIRTN